MKHFVRYNIQTGAIDGFGNGCDDDAIITAARTRPLLVLDEQPSENPCFHSYVDLTDPANLVVLPKQDMAPVVTGRVVSNLPIPCTAVIEKVSYEITDGTLELEPSLPGPYEITLSSVKFLELKVSVT